MTRILIVLFAVVGLSLAATVMSGCNRASSAGFAMPPPVVTTAPVTIADVPVYLDEIGRTTATEVVNVVPQVSGQITKISFTDGQYLKAGQQLFLIEPTPFQALLDQAEAALQQNKAQLENAKSNFARVASELPSKAVSQQDFDNAQAAVDVAAANVKAAQAQIETAKWNLGNCVINSPIEGQAGQRLVDRGNVVNANSTNLVNIQKLVPIYVDFTVPENQLDRVRLNMKNGTLKVEVNCPNMPKTTIDGDLTFLDNAVQDGTGTIKLRATVQNKERLLWPGQFVSVRLILATLKDAKLIPSEAMQIGQQGPFVFIVGKNDVAEQQNITPGQRQGSMTVVEQGLDGNETIVQSGQMMLNPGEHVQIQSSAGQMTAGGGGNGAGGNSAGGSGTGTGT
jgi:membrane fusion protein, multidrug efflux system